MKGRPAPWSRRKHSKEEIENRRKKMIGRRWWNNGIDERLSYKQPNEDWILGKLSKTLPQMWEVISPDGVVYVINNLCLFCRENFNKATSVLANVAYGIKKWYKGWKCRKLTKYEYA